LTSYKKKIAGRGGNIDWIQGWLSGFTNLLSIIFLAMSMHKQAVAIRLIGWLENITEPSWSCRHQKVWNHRANTVHQML
jgi:pyocin large subunit-like protein